MTNPHVAHSFICLSYDSIPFSTPFRHEETHCDPHQAPHCDFFHGQFHVMSDESAPTPEGELYTCSTSLSEETGL